MEAVRTEVVDDILVVTLDRPRANAIDVATSHALYDAFARLESDPALRVGIVTGAGERFFSAGWDLKAAAAGEAVDADHGPGGFAGPDRALRPHHTGDRGRERSGAGRRTGAGPRRRPHGAGRARRAGAPGGAGRGRGRLRRAAASPAPASGRRRPRAAADRSPDGGRRGGTVGTGQPRRAGRRADRRPPSTSPREIRAGAPLAWRRSRRCWPRPPASTCATAFARMRSGDLTAYTRMLGSEDAVEGPRAFAEKRPPEWTGR